MEYTNMADVFMRLNRADCEYVVLRNYDNLLEHDIYMAGHGDVDMLCRNVEMVVDAIGAKPCNPSLGKFGDGTHFYIIYNGKHVSIDLRSVGDGYYCSKWQDAILTSRVGHECFFVMDEENHLYSLIYHAIFQKPCLSEEYRQRLSLMAGGGLMSESQLVDMLEDYMRAHDYKYVYASDFHVPLRCGVVKDRSLVQATLREWWPHFVFGAKVEAIEFLVKIKHAIFGVKK